MRYAGEIVQQLNIMFATHSCISCVWMGNKSNYCKWLAEYFSAGLCENAKYNENIIEKRQGNGRASGGAIDLGEAVLRRKRETEWMLK